MPLRVHKICTSVSRQLTLKRIVGLVLAVQRGEGGSSAKEEIIPVEIPFSFPHLPLPQH